jgi:hypothetical protein
MLYIDPENEEQWNAFERKVYEDIKLHAVSLELNKKWTKEKETKKGMKGVREICKTLA